MSAADIPAWMERTATETAPTLPPPAPSPVDIADLLALVRAGIVEAATVLDRRCVARLAHVASDVAEWQDVARDLAAVEACLYCRPRGAIARAASIAAGLVAHGRMWEAASELAYAEGITVPAWMMRRRGLR